MWTILGVFFILLIMGVPVAFDVGIASVIYLFSQGEDLIILTQRVFAGGDSFTLMAIPLFIFAGEIMNACGVTRRIVGFANELVGFIPGGLAHVNIFASMIFAGVSGSTSADVASIGGMLIGSMNEAGFDLSYATAVTAASATIGSIIPPSILMVLYSSITGISVGKLFMAGVVPGILIGITQMIYAFLKAKSNPDMYDGNNKLRFNGKRCLKAFINAVPALIMPLIIIGGILSGVFTATEAGAIAGLYGLLIGVFLYKEFTFQGAIHTIISSAKTSGMTMLIVSGATAFGYCLAIEKFPNQVSKLITGVSSNPNVLMLLMILAMTIIGMFMDTTSAAIIMVPIFFPIAEAAGINGIHFGMVMVLTFVLGGITPPVGVTLYIAVAVAKLKLGQLLKEMWPFILLFVAVMMLVAYVPMVCLFLPNLIGG
ncbi:MAG: TRAP transporter large permease [Lachnospiraceae bacterium]|nr:TRAP transporter large permease [Lachnospiraceae bacterium]